MVDGFICGNKRRHLKIRRDRFRTKILAMRFRLSTLLLSVGLIAVWLAIDVSPRNTRWCLLPIFGSVFGVVGALAAIRREQSAVMGAAKWGTLTGAFLGILRAIIALVQAQESPFEYGNWKILASSPLLGIILCLPVGLLVGPIVARCIRFFQERFRR
jgi:uncharacterized membrane protein YeiH